VRTTLCGAARDVLGGVAGKSDDERRTRGGTKGGNERGVPESLSKGRNGSGFRPESRVQTLAART
jgi:hypothetical protein